MAKPVADKALSFAALVWGGLLAELALLSQSALLPVYGLVVLMAKPMASSFADFLACGFPRISQMR